MTGGMFDHLTQAGHIVAGMGVTFDEALKIVADANKIEIDEHTAALLVSADALNRSAAILEEYNASFDEPIALGNVIYGVPWGQPKPKDRGTL